MLVVPAQHELRDATGAARQPGPAASCRGHRRAAASRRDTGEHGSAAGSQSAAPGTPLGELASRDFTIVRAGDVVVDVIRRVWRKGAIMALVVPDRGLPRGDDSSGRHHQGACRQLGSRQHQRLSEQPVMRGPFLAAVRQAKVSSLVALDMAASAHREQSKLRPRSPADWPQSNRGSTPPGRPSADFDRINIAGR